MPSPKGAVDFDYRHKAAIRAGNPPADTVSQNWRFCARRMAQRHGS